MFRSINIVSILDGAVCDSEADVEAVYTINPSKVAQLIESLRDGSVHCRVLGATTVGSPSFTLTAIEASIDGTNYYTWVTFGTAVTCSGDGELGLRPIAATNPIDHRTTKLRLVMGGSAPDGSNYLTLTVDVVGYALSQG